MSVDPSLVRPVSVPEEVSGSRGWLVLLKLLDGCVSCEPRKVPHVLFCTSAPARRGRNGLCESSYPALLFYLRLLFCLLTASEDGVDGELAVGGVDENRFIGDIHFSPVVDPRYWMIDTKGMKCAGELVAPTTKVGRRRTANCRDSCRRDCPSTEAPWLHRFSYSERVVPFL